MTKDREYYGPSWYPANQETRTRMSKDMATADFPFVQMTTRIIYTGKFAGMAIVMDYIGMN